jgi:hypothetical protein
LPGNVKPLPYLDFVNFSIAVFDHLHSLGWNRLKFAALEGSNLCRYVVESFPLAAWRKLGISPLPAKRKARKEDIERCSIELSRQFPLQLPRDPTHDELQAIVAGLGGLGIELGDTRRYTVDGGEPFLLDGIWREGFIVNPRSS